MDAVPPPGPDRLAYALTFPAELSSEQVLAWLQALSGLLPGGVARLGGAPSVAMEVWLTREHGFRFRLRVPRPQATYVVGQLRSAVPGVRAEPTDAATADNWTRVVELGMRGLTRSLRVEPAQLAGSLLASLQGCQLGAQESIVLQWIIRPAVPERPPTPLQGRRRVRMWQFSLEVPAPPRDAINDARVKLNAVNFLGVLRIGVQARDVRRAGQLLAGVRTALGSVGTSASGLYARTARQERLQRDLTTARAPFLFPIQVTAEELAGLLAWPIDAPHVAGLPLARSRQLPPSGAIAADGLVVAQADFPGAERPLALSAVDACKHVHIVGPIGVGKTALAGNLAIQAMAADCGVIVLESKGDLFRLALDAVPAHRREDVIVLDVGDSHPVGFNVLAEGDSRIAVEELCQLFEYLYPEMRRGVWARAALYRGLATLITRPGAAFIDLVPLLAPSARGEREQQWRDELIGEVTDPELSRFWQRFDGLSAAQQEAYAAPVLDRVWQLNERPEIRRIIGQSTSSFSLREVLRQRQILLINLSGLGIETARLTGTLLLNSIWSAVRSGAADPASPTHLCLDEFQDFLHLPVDPETLLVRARSYGLAMVLAHQHLDQLPTGIRSAVLANARSKVVFQTTADDARVFAREFGQTVSEDDFLHLGQYEVLCRLATGAGVSPPVSAVTLPPPEDTGVSDEIRASSRACYGRDPDDIEADIARRRTARSPRTTKRPRLGGTSWDG